MNGPVLLLVAATASCCILVLLANESEQRRQLYERIGPIIAQTKINFNDPQEDHLESLERLQDNREKAEELAKEDVDPAKNSPRNETEVDTTTSSSSSSSSITPTSATTKNEKSSEASESGRSTTSSTPATPKVDVRNVSTTIDNVTFVATTANPPQEGANKKDITTGNTESVKNENLTLGQASNKTRKIYAVMGSDANPTYLFPLIVTVRVWKRMGVDSIICSPNTEEQLLENNRSAMVYEDLQSQGVQFIFLNTTLAPPHTVSQTCRMFVAASPYLNVSDYDLLITTDSDLWLFHLDEHLPKGNQSIFLYNADCCGLVSKPGSAVKFPHYPMSTITMTAALWREVLGVNATWLTDGDVLARRLYAEFNVDYIAKGRGKPNLSESWYADQVLISEKIFLWLKGKDASQVLGKFPHVDPMQRLDRINWHYDTPGFPLNLQAFRDAHILHPLHTANNWNRTLPLLRVLFDNDTLSHLNDFHAEFLKA